MRHISMILCGLLMFSISVSYCGAQSATTIPAQSGPSQSGPSPTAMSPEQMQQRMQSLESQVSDLRSRIDQQTAPGSSTTTPINPTDAQITAGYSLDNGFHIQSADGSFLLHPWAFIQGRDAYSYRSIATNDRHDGENGLELPRAKFIIDGNIFSRDLTYQLIWATSDTTGNLGLQDGWGRYHFPGTVFAVEAGNIRDPADHESFLYATKSLTPERSIVNNVLLNGDNIVKAVELTAGYDNPGYLRGSFAFTGGERDFNTTFQNYPTNPASWGLAGRIEYKPMGNWKDYAQFTSLDEKESLLVLGAGADYTEGGPTAGLTHIADAQFKLPEGLTLYTAYLGRYVRHDAGSPAGDGNPTSDALAYASHDTYDATVRVMAGYLIERRFEPFVRYEYLHLDAHEFATPTNYDISDITLGANYYFYGQRAKLSVGASYLPQGSPLSNTLGDLLPTHRGQEFLLQTQFQLIF
jgi:hypothetical protein